MVMFFIFFDSGIVVGLYVFGLFVVFVGFFVIYLLVGLFVLIVLFFYVWS